VTVELIQGLLLAFALIVILMGPYIRLLQALGFGKRIRQEGPESHFVKEGTPTMGGLLVVAVVLGIYFFLRQPTRRPSRRSPRWPASERWARSTTTSTPARGGYPRPPEAHLADGGRVRGGMADPADVCDHRHRGPLRRSRRDRAVGVRVVAAFAIIAAANGVKHHRRSRRPVRRDRRDAFVAYMLVALLNAPAQPNLAFLCALIIGALLGFLWFNVHPAQIFIGDSGALSLGATLAVTALITGQILVLPLIGIIFVLETVSVILQVAYFRATGGKRLFRMSPIHHHFELGGWDEEKITIRFWIIAILAALLGVTLFLATQPGRFF
jgi:phospho-N-acetylmuramoyl-pentapeptide-transferase